MEKKSCPNCCHSNLEKNLAFAFFSSNIGKIGARDTAVTKMCLQCISYPLTKRCVSLLWFSCNGTIQKGFFIFLKIYERKMEPVSIH